MITPVPKTTRVSDRKTVESIRSRRCEHCYRYGPTHVHHVRSKGAGGPDIPENLIALCSRCHEKAHRGLIRKSVLFERVAKRLGRSPTLVQDKVRTIEGGVSVG
jgi:5-methylcytosine-specific restriction endonuclease McrA